MNLRDYVNGLDGKPQKEGEKSPREQYADRCDTSVAYLYQIAGGHSKPSGPLARKLAQESGFLVSLQELRPDIFGAAPVLAPAATTVAKTTEQAGATYG